MAEINHLRKFEATALKTAHRTNSEGKTFPRWEVEDKHGWYSWRRPLTPEEFIVGALRALPDGHAVRVTVEALP